MRKILILTLIPLFLLSSDFKKEKEKVFDELMLIMTKQEKKEFKKIDSQEELRKFVEDFWRRRDPDPSDERNEVKETYYKRMEETKRLFREPGRKPWLTDRGRVYMILGRPTFWKKEVMQKGTTENYERWDYEDLHLVIFFVDRHGMGKYELSQPSPKFIDIYEHERKFFLPRATKVSMTLSVEIDRKAKKLYIHIPLNSFAFTKKEGKFYANFLLRFSYGHPQEAQPRTFEQKMSVGVSAKDIKAGNKEITIPLSIAPLKGEYVIIIEIEDLVSGNKVSKTYKLKI